MEGGEEDQQSPLQRSFSSPADREELLERTGNLTPNLSLLTKQSF